MAALGADQCDHAQQNHQRGAVEYQHSNASKKDPPRHNIQEAIQPLTVPESHVNVNALAKDQMHTAQGNCQNQHGQRVFHRVDHKAVAERLEPLRELILRDAQEGLRERGNHVAEETARENAAEDNAAAQPFAQTEHVSQGILWLVLFGDDNAGPAG